MRHLAAGLAVASLCIATPAAAYWEYGHEAVADVAWLQMKPETRAKVAALLRQSRLLETPDCPANTLAQAAYWADCVKPLDERFSYAFSWHYQNVNVCKPFELKDACKDGNCVSAQIERNARLLANPKVPVRERVMALAMLTHFVGDLHQPMHAGDHADLGGNRVAANYGLVGGRANLHSIWDGYLAERAISTPPSYAAGLLGQIPSADRAQIAQGTVEDWSREQWAKSRDLAYKTLVGDPCAEGEKVERPTLDEQDVQALIPELRKSVVDGGIRLARLLDDALGPEHKAPPLRR